MNRKSKIIPFSILTMLLIVGSGVLSSCSGPSTSGTSTTTTTTTTTSDSTSISSTTTTTTTIPVVEVTSVTLSDAEVSLEVEATKQLTVVVLPATATVKDVTWTSSNVKFAKVSTSGLVTAVAEGTATITATSGTCSDTCVVTVKKKVIPVASVTLSETAFHVEEKQTHKLTATIAPTTATIQTVDWSSSAINFATVDSKGLVTAVAPGESTITAKAGDKTATCKVTVTAAPIAVTSVEVTPATASLEVEATQQLTAVVLPVNATVRDIVWTTNVEAVATVSTTGLVTAIAEGTATITATSGNFSDTCVVTVKPKVIPVASVTVTPATATLEVEATKQLSVEVLPANATDRKVTWTSSNAEVATVLDGLVTAIAKGEATITATSGGFSSTCVVTINNKFIPVDSIAVVPTSVSIEEKQTQKLTATVLPATATDPTVTWTSSMPDVATVDAAGLVTALIPGNTIITATAGDKTVTCAVTITAAPIPVESVTITPASVTIEASHTEQLAATVLPANATDPTVGWTTSNAAVATVDSNGLVTAIAQGSAIITATAESKTGNCSVTVTPQIFPVTSVEVTPATATLIEQDTQQLEAKVLPTNATVKDVTWSSSNETIAKVSTTGLVTAVAPGKATITATSGGFSDTCEVTVNKRIISVVSVAIAPTSVDLVEQDTTTLTATVLPVNATDKSIVWSSDKTNIATVSTAGLVTAIAPGTAIITATTNDGNKTATCTVKVTARIIPVTGVTVNPSKTTIIEGAAMTLTAIVAPENATTQTVVWSSDKTDIASVDQNGVVTAIKPGTATIKATSGTLFDTCAVTVEKRIIPVASVTVDPTTVSLEELATKKLTATISPTDATDKSIVWSSDKTNIATVDSTGLVTAVKAGTAIITARASGNITGTCTVTVTAPTAGAIAVTGAKELYATGEDMIVSLGVSMSNGTTVNYANVNLVTGANKPANATITGFNTATDGKKSGTITMGSQTSTINYVVYQVADSEVSLRGLITSSTEKTPVVVGLTNDITIGVMLVTRPIILYGITSQANPEITISAKRDAAGEDPNHDLLYFDGAAQSSLVNSTVEFHNIKINAYNNDAAFKCKPIRFINCAAINVLFEKTVINSDWYPITFRRGNDHATLSVIDSKLSGWSTLNIWDSYMTINVQNSTLTGTSVHDGHSDDYAVIIMNTPDSTRPIKDNVINIKDCTIKAIGNNIVPEYCIDLRTTNAIVNFSGKNFVSFTKGNAANTTPCYLKGENANQFRGLDTLSSLDELDKQLKTFMTNADCVGL